MTIKRLQLVFVGLIVRMKPSQDQISAGMGNRRFWGKTRTLSQFLMTMKLFTKVKNFILRKYFQISETSKFFILGHFKLLNFSSHHKCANLDRDWDGQLNTFDPNGHCLIIYDEFNCSSSNIGRNVTIPSNISATEVSTFLKVRNFDRVAQSLKLCEWDGQPEKFVGFETSAKSIFFVVLFSLVAISCVSVGLAFVVKKTFGNGFEIKFNMRSRGSGHSLIL